MAELTIGRTITTPDSAPLAGMVGALTLVESQSPRQLRQRAETLLQQRLGIPRASCLVLDSSGRWLSDEGQGVRLACDDFTHPYAHAIRRGEPMQIALGEARSRLDHPAFQALIADCAAGWQLTVRPLRAPDDDQQWLGVMSLVGPRDTLDPLTASLDFAAFEALFCQLWAWHLRQQGERQHQANLQDSLTRFNADARRQTLSGRLSQQIKGDSTSIQTLRDQAVRAAETQLAVLLRGETGTGKDLVARGIHGASARAEGPFMALNCAAIPESLLESELFGYARGAFSGADRDQQGLVGQADGGTLFLDEIGDMPLSLQAKLLRVLESGRYRPLGASEECRVDLRLIAATHQPLHQRMRDGHFRADLYYRLNQFPLALPPLRERREDIEPLVQAFIADFCEREGRELVGISRAALADLHDRDYPGNVRELKNLIDYACAMTHSGDDIDLMVLPRSPIASDEAVDQLESQAVRAADDEDDIADLRQALRDYEASLIQQRLALFDGNRTLAAESLGLPKRTLAHKCRQLQLDNS
ncbi:sigma 54-interacting transcriptional regulator [Halomonas sp. I1]|uniref:sigma-54 interaction domain-containing protein n=1 Tax=Halomonas sp. I1 TaxID=393536 RepID=UPI0028DE5447|nr:sigma 54-interacting transcriptional regulator [Halomonas sp. I1]MDT8893311.1 sigma 54-interacting transcriptional regulator [Halomonas sp. I1]